MKRIFFCLLCTAAVISATAQVRTVSPDGRYVMTVCDTGARLSFSIRYEGEPVVLSSPLGYAASPDSSARLKIADPGKSRRTSDRWRPVYGERSEIRDRYNERIVRLSGGSYPQELVIRAYDEGVAYRFRTSLKEEIVVADELVDIRFPEDYNCNIINGCLYFTDNEGITYNYSNLLEFDTQKKEPAFHVWDFWLSKQTIPAERIIRRGNPFSLSVHHAERRSNCPPSCWAGNINAGRARKKPSRAP